MSRILWSAFAGALVLIGFWLAGFDFDKRGGTALICYFITVFAFSSVYFLIGEKPIRD